MFKVSTESARICHPFPSECVLPLFRRRFCITVRAFPKVAGLIAGEHKSAIPLDVVNLLAPIQKPDKIACAYLNYGEHCDERSVKYPLEPIFLSKFSSVIVGPNDDIKLPHISKSVDAEVSLAVVIGKKAKAVNSEDANDYIFGYTVAQDIIARDWSKKNNGQLLLGKTMDTFCPIGPAVVPKEYIKNPNDLLIKSWLNGRLMQDGNTSDQIFKPTYLVHYLSQIVTLYPGDLILTGTPKGVGGFKDPPEFLKRGDILESEIEIIGRLKNNIV